MGIGAHSATVVSQALLDKPYARGKGVGMSRPATGEEVSRQPADLAGGLRNDNATTAARIGARAKEQV